MQFLKYNDGYYSSKWLSKFISKMSSKGKKYIIEKILYYSFFLIKKKLKFYPLFIYFEVLEKIKISVGLKLNKSKWKNSKNTAVKAFPYLLNISAQYKKSILWLTQAIKLRLEKNLSLKIYSEFYDILFNFSGNTLKKKKDYYKYVILFKTVKKFKW